VETTKKLFYLRIASAVFSAFGVFDASYLFYSKMTKSTIVCTPGSECDAVNASPYAMLLGIPVSAIGIVGYLALLVLAIWVLIKQDDVPAWFGQLRLTAASIGLFFAAYLTGIEAFVLHAYCIWCVLQAIAITFIFAGILLERKFEDE
jgi:uncharacterized membrane protein